MVCTIVVCIFSLGMTHIHFTNFRMNIQLLHGGARLLRVLKFSRYIGNIFHTTNSKRILNNIM